MKFKIYNTKAGMVIQEGEDYYFNHEVGLEQLFKSRDIFSELNTMEKYPLSIPIDEIDLLPPIGTSQELWASDFTYLNCKLEGRQNESEDFYSKVYESDRPALFYKANYRRISGHNGNVKIRKDSSWNVAEPELTLAINAYGDIIGYTIGIDMSSRSLEDENPLYLQQAKTYDGCAALGPCVLISPDPMPMSTTIHMLINRDGKNVFDGKIRLSQIKRKFTDLVSYLFRETSFPYGCFLMTGTGIMLDKGFSVLVDDEIQITIEGIGTLVNTVK
jgi:2-dehydro-3-deoxy-D-arabinonate dehydratase